MVRATLNIDTGVEMAACAHTKFESTVLYPRGHLSAPTVSHGNSPLYGAFIRARRVLDSQKRRFAARADDSDVRGLGSRDGIRDCDDLD